MTVIGCTAACDAAGYKLAGVEYASKITLPNWIFDLHLGIRGR